MRGPGAGSRRPKGFEHDLGVRQATRFEIFLRCQQGFMQSRTVFRIEPIARIERQEVDHRTLWELGRLVHQKASVPNLRLDRHARRISAP